MKIMLDSGAYSAHTKNIKIDIDQYIEFVRTNSHMFEVCVNLDVIGDGKASYENWIYLRKNGVDTMPVYHIGTDEIWLQKYLKETDYVGIGAIANLSTARRFYGLDHVWKKYLNHSQCKVHGMGFSAIDILMAYPWHSVNTISPILQASYGGIYLPLIQREQFNFLKLYNYKISNKSKDHMVGTTASYFSLPSSIRKKYEAYFESQGYVIGKLRWSKETRQLIVENDQFTFTGSYLRRVLWNLDMCARMAESINPNMTVYVGGTSHFKAIIDRGLGSWLSYSVVNSKQQLSNLLNPLSSN